MQIARTAPDTPAIIMTGSGKTVTYRELEGRSNRLAHLFRSLGLRPGDHIALMFDNSPAFHDVCWAAHRSGLVYTPISIHLSVEDIAYILADCDASVFVVSSKVATAAAEAARLVAAVEHRFVVGNAVEGFASLEDAVASLPDVPIADPAIGVDMCYSSGTTGRPKEVVRAPEDIPFGHPKAVMERSWPGYGFSSDTRFLVPNPVYHSAPMRLSMLVHMLGGTVVMMERFDAEQVLKAIERFRVNHGLFVPTMFVRMLGLEDETRNRYDLSSMRQALHAAAPCPIRVKEKMIGWWGPIISEVYGNTEECGFTAISTEEWVNSKGSIGRPTGGVFHVLDDEGFELPPGSPGTVWVEGSKAFSYYKDRANTEASRNDRGWQTVGDVGYLDDRGFLYLTDRAAFTINSGGVKISSKEVEDALATHPKVVEAAVFGVPDREFGEQVKAVVQLEDSSWAGPALEAELILYCQARLSKMKAPKSIDFEAALPRNALGKLMKRSLKERYWPKARNLAEAGQRTTITGSSARRRHPTPSRSVPCSAIGGCRSSGNAEAKPTILKSPR